MSDNITEVENTGQQAHFETDRSKVFIFNNEFVEGVLLNDSGGVKTFEPGMLLGRVPGTNKLVHLQSASIDGSELPVGILASTVKDLADAAEQNVSMCVSGNVAKEKVILEGADTLDTVIDERRIEDRIGGDTQGIKLVVSSELTSSDNS